MELSTLNVLLVEDEPFMRAMVKRMLAMANIKQISEAIDGTDGLEKLGEGPCDLVVLDIEMAPMNGLEFLKRVRIGATDVRRDVPVIVLTGSNDGAVLGSAMALDCDAFIPKAESPEIIQQRIVRSITTGQEMKDTADYATVALPKNLIGAMPDGSSPASAQEEADEPDIRVIPIDEAEVGMMVEQDLFTPEGHLIVGAGTVLTESCLNRLQDICSLIDMPPITVRKT